MDGNTRLCTTTSAQALKESFGSDGQPGSYADAIMDFAQTSPRPRWSAGCVEVVNTCESQTAIKIKWLRTRMKQTAPQAFLVAS